MIISMKCNIISLLGFRVKRIDGDSFSSWKSEATFNHPLNLIVWNQCIG